MHGVCLNIICMPKLLTGCRQEERGITVIAEVFSRVACAMVIPLREIRILSRKGKDLGWRRKFIVKFKMLVKERAW